MYPIKLPTAKSELRLWYMELQLEDAYSRSLLQNLICGPT